MIKGIKLQKLELIVRCETWEEAKTILAGVGVYEKSKTSYRPVRGMFIVSTELENSLDGQGYKKIEDDEHTAILSDSDSLKRAREILDKIYEIETQVRKLLLHISDSVGYFEVFYQTSEYTRNFSNEKDMVTCKGKLDPLTSHLTFGEMMDILGYDLSWAARAVKSDDLNKLIASSANFEDFKSKMNEKIQPLFVWDVISKEVLKKNLPWPSIQKRLNDIKKTRNKFAHHHVITEKEKNELIKKADLLLKDITPTKPLSAVDLDKLIISNEQISRTIELLIKEHHASLIRAFAKQQSEIAARIYATIAPSVDIAHAFTQANRATFTNIAKSVKSIQGTYVDPASWARDHQAPIRLTTKITQARMTSLAKTSDKEKPKKDD